MGAARGIFISYRRATSAGYAGRVRDHLIARYGADNVFMDVDSIAPGTDFVDAIDFSLSRSRAVLVVIDPHWASVVDEHGHPRLMNSPDWVRTEIERSLSRAADHEVALVPVLVGGADFPSDDQLPDAIQGLTRYNGVELRDAHFETDLDDVMKRLGGGWRRLVKLAVAGVALSALVLVLTWLAFRDTSTPEVDLIDSSPMSGDLNVAVAEFTTIDESGSVVADPEFTLDESIAGELEQQLAELDDTPFTYDIRPPENVGVLDGASEAERAEAAAELAARLEADVVIYGFREPDSPQTITPEFYVSARNLGDAVELAGPYAMGARINDGVGPALIFREELRSEFLARTSSLTDFVVGLANLKLDDPEVAREWFVSAVNGVSEWDMPTNSEVFHLYLGSANLQLGDLEAAESAYQTALGLSPGYARAMIGLAEIEFQTKRGNCFPGTTDDAGLQEAFDQFNTAAAQPAPASAQIQNKAALGRGRVIVCRSQAGSVSDWDAGRAELTAVIDAYNGGQSEIRELAALAYGARALTALRLNESVPTEAALREAAVDLDRGFELTQRAETKESYAGLLGFVYDGLGDAASTELWCGRTPEPCPATLASPTESPEGAEPDDAEPPTVTAPEQVEPPVDPAPSLPAGSQPAPAVTSPPNQPPVAPSNQPPVAPSNQPPVTPNEPFPDPFEPPPPTVPGNPTDFPDVLDPTIQPAQPPRGDFPDVLGPALPATK